MKQKHIAKNAVTSKKVKDASLLARDFAPNQLPVASKAERGEKGDTGPQGPKGDTGPQGIPGPVDTADFETKVARSGDTLSGAVTTVGAPGQSSGFVGDSWGAVLPEGVAEPTFDFVTTPDTQCPGVGQATAGRLCIYVISENNRNDGYAYVVGDWWNATNRRYGWAFELEWLTPTPGAFGWLSASWAYQVP